MDMCASYKHMLKDKIFMHWFQCIWYPSPPSEYISVRPEPENAKFQFPAKVAKILHVFITVLKSAPTDHAIDAKLVKKKEKK